MSDPERDAARKAVRERLFGPAASTAAAPPAGVTRLLTDWSEQAVWDVWGSPGLAMKARCLATVSILAAQGRMWQLEKHIEGALRNGWTPEELGELMVHVGLYCGVPTAADAMGALDRVLARRNGDGSSGGFLESVKG